MRGLSRARRQRGVTLLVAMLILVAVMLVGASAARMALQGEQAARAGRDRQIAFQAAEDALMDGERDVIRMATDGTAPVSAGLGARPAGGAAPAWQTVDLSGAEDGGSHTAQFGDYSGASMQTGSGFLPFRRPRYLIERMPCHQPGEEVGAPGGFCYRVTAIGFGTRPETEVVLQSVYRQAE